MLSRSPYVINVPLAFSNSWSIAWGPPNRRKGRSQRRRRRRFSGSRRLRRVCIMIPCYGATCTAMESGSGERLETCVPNVSEWPMHVISFLSPFLSCWGSWWGRKLTFLSFTLRDCRVCVYVCTQGKRENERRKRSITGNDVEPPVEEQKRDTFRPSLSFSLLPFNACRFTVSFSSFQTQTQQAFTSLFVLPPVHSIVLCSCFLVESFVFLLHTLTSLSSQNPLLVKRMRRHSDAQNTYSPTTQTPRNTRVMWCVPHEHWFPCYTGTQRVMMHVCAS